MQSTRRTWLGALAAALGTVRRIPGAESSEQALIFGTVFQGSYLALPGAKVVAWTEDRPKKKHRGVTNYRGEFRIRVPAGDATYILEASAPKFSSGRRTVEVWGIEKSTANLILQPRKGRAKGNRAEGGK